MSAESTSVQRDGTSFESEGPRGGPCASADRTAAPAGAEVRQVRQARRPRQAHEAVAQEERADVELAKRVEHEADEQRAPEVADERRRRLCDQLPVHLADDEHLSHQNREDQPRLPPEPVAVPVHTECWNRLLYEYEYEFSTVMYRL